MRTEAIERNGTSLPLLLRILMFQRSSMLRRSAASPCRLTCQVRPNRLKLFT